MDFIHTNPAGQSYEVLLGPLELRVGDNFPDRPGQTEDIPVQGPFQGVHGPYIGCGLVDQYSETVGGFGFHRTLKNLAETACGKPEKRLKTYEDECRNRQNQFVFDTRFRDLPFTLDQEDCKSVLYHN